MATPLKSTRLIDMDDPPRHQQPCTLVLDVGKTNVVLLLMDKAGTILDTARLRNQSLEGPPYPHVDTEKIWQFLLEAAADFAANHVIDAIVPTTHGCTAALVSADGLVLPIVDYETEVPDEAATAFCDVAPTFAETQSPNLPAGLNLGRHLFWLQRDFPEAFYSAECLLTYPQYWAWRLCGVTASEITSIGCHAHLWDPRKRCFSSLVERQGWTHLFPPLQPAYAALGSLRPELATQTGLSADCRVYNGIHDSNSAYCLYLKGRSAPFSLVSTGTWVVMISPRLPLDRLNEERDTLAFVDLMGEPVPAARYMGGREFEILTSQAGDSREFSEADLRKVIAEQSMLLPSYAPGGPFMGRQGSTLGPEPHTDGETLARVTLYCALMTATSTRMLEMDGDLMIDGGFVNNELYCRLLATLAGCDQCFVNHETEGTAVGAGMLPAWEAEDVESPLQLGRVERFDDPALRAYIERWQCAVESS